MKRTVVISLSLLSLLLCAIVVAEVKYLYSGIGQKGNEAAVAVADATDESPVQETQEPASAVIEKPQQESEEAAAALKEEIASKIAEGEKDALQKDVSLKDAAQDEAQGQPKAPKTRSFKVKNCATGKMNTLRQFPDNSLQLIDEKGKALWTVKLSAPIADCVSQVDFYNNGKIQFLFVVGDKLHLIDRLGRQVSSFPKQLPFNATDGPTQCKSKGKSYWMIESKAEKAKIYVDFSSKAMKILNELPK